MPIQPATLAFASDGTPYSAAYDDLYHTVAGGLEQARQVFLAGNDLPARWCGQERFVILEVGRKLGIITVGEENEPADARMHPLGEFHPVQARRVQRAEHRIESHPVRQVQSGV